MNMDLALFGYNAGIKISNKKQKDTIMNLDIQKSDTNKNCLDVSLEFDDGRKITTTIQLQSVNILGTEYRIEIHKVSDDEYLKDNRLSGYCAEDSKIIVIADMSEKDYFQNMDEEEQKIYRKRVLRHEIIHAFLNESGLSDSSNRYTGAWAKNEEMVDWFAIQSPKIYKSFAEVGAI